MAIIINANREGYGLDQIGRTLTAGELIELLQDFDEDTPVYIGNDRKDYGLYTYGGISWDDVQSMDQDEDEEEEEYEC